MLLLSSAAAQTPSTQETPAEERLLRLEARVDSLAKANSALRRELGVDGKSGQTVVKPSGQEPILQFGGLLQVQSDFRDQVDNRFGTHDRFYLRRARLNASGRFLEDFEFRLEAELAGSLQEISGLRAQLTDGYMSWNRFAFANVRFGQFKTPFGYEQLHADARLFTVERSLANDRLTLSRQIGTQISGESLERRLTYAAGIFNGSSVNTSSNDNDNFLGAGRLAGILHQGRWGENELRWSVGSNAYLNHDTNQAGFPPEFGFDSTPGGTADNTFTGERFGWGVDSQLRIGPLDVWVEYLQVRLEPSNGVPSQRIEADGGYAQAACFIVPRRLQVVAKWDRFDPQRHVGDNATQTWTAGVNFLVKGDDIKLQLNGLAADPEATPDMRYKILGRIQAIF